jgi:hypothetical protein
MEPEGSSLPTQQSATCPYPDPVYAPIQPLKDPF